MFLVRTLFVILLHTPGVSTSACLFPDFLQTGEQSENRWMYRVHDQGRLGMDANLMYASFLSSVMKVATNVGFRVQPKPSPYSRLCVEVVEVEVAVKDGGLGLDQYIVQHQFTGQDSDGEITFTCMTFEQQNENVVLVKESPRQLTTNGSLCDSLEPQHWPLVSFRNTQVQYVPEGIAGGYDVIVEDDRVGVQQYCDNDLQGLTQTRLEIGCPPQSSILVTFPFDCQPSGLLMDAIQRLISLGSWTSTASNTSYTFMVMTAPLQQNKLWCLRMPEAPSGNFLAHLFLDVVCDPSEVIQQTTNFLTLNLTRRAVDSVCGDGHSRCHQVVPEVCDGDLHYWCIKSCNNCASAFSLVDGDCTIPVDYRGTWRQVTQHMETDLLIEQDTVVIGSYAPFRCIHQAEGEELRFPVVYNSKNGCYPRFSCIELGQRSQGVIKYKLAQTHEWPASVFHFKDPSVLCDDSQFSGEIDPITNRFTVPVFSNIVSLRNSTPVDCDVGDLFFLFNYQTIVNNDRECKGSFATPCSDPTTIRINHSECGIWNAQDYTCVASFKGRDGDHIVLTQSYSEEVRRFHCWIFKHTLNDLIVLPSTDCHENSRMDIEQYRVPRPDKVLFDIQSIEYSACTETTAGFEETTTEVPEVSTLDPLDGVGAASSLVRHTVTTLLVLLVAFSLELCYI